MWAAWAPAFAGDSDNARERMSGGGDDIGRAAGGIFTTITHDLNSCLTSMSQYRGIVVIWNIEYHTSTTDTSRVIRAVAHRGAKALAQENSIEAFTRAAEYGVPAIEIDVRLAADFGVPIIHDRTLERTYGHPGVVASMTTTELRELGVPQLSELLAGSAQITTSTSTSRKSAPFSQTQWGESWRSRVGPAEHG